MSEKSESTVCAICGKNLTFDVASDIAAMKEAQELWGSEIKSGEVMEVTCDECHVEFMKWWEAEGKFKWRKQ